MWIAKSLEFHCMGFEPELAKATFSRVPFVKPFKQHGHGGGGNLGVVVLKSHVSSQITVLHDTESLYTVSIEESLLQKQLLG